MCVQILPATKPLPFGLLVWANGAVSPWLVYADRSLFNPQGSLTRDGRRLVELALVGLRRQIQPQSTVAPAPPALRSAG